MGGRARQKHALHCKYLPKQGFGQRLSGHVQGGQRLMNIHTRDNLNVSHCYLLHRMDNRRRLHHSPGECVEWASDSRLTEPRERQEGSRAGDERGDMKVYAVTRARIRHVIFIRQSQVPQRSYHVNYMTTDTNLQSRARVKGLPPKPTWTAVIRRGRL